MNQVQRQRETGWDNDYPRQQMKRNDYIILNKGWKLNGHDITVPFVPQSELSGYKEEVAEHMTYEVLFVLPDFLNQDRLLLHFGAVDQIAEIWLNDTFVGKHEGGYNSFSFDIQTTINGKPSEDIKDIVSDMIIKQLS